MGLFLKEGINIMKKSIALLLAAATAMSLLAGCGSSSTAETTAAETEASAASVRSIIKRN